MSRTPTPKAIARRAEFAAWSLDQARRGIDHELARGNLAAAVRILLGHAETAALATAAAEEAYPAQFKPSPHLGDARRVRRAWIAAVREIGATIAALAPTEGDDAP